MSTISVPNRFPSVAPCQGPDEGDEGHRSRGLAIAEICGVEQIPTGIATNEANAVETHRRAAPRWVSAFIKGGFGPQPTRRRLQRHHNRVGNPMIIFKSKWFSILGHRRQSGPP